MDVLNRLLEISSRLDHLENAAEWIAKESVRVDSGISNTGTLITVLADDLRDKICALVRDLERGFDDQMVN